MKIIYLDQNQWIRFARAVKRPDDDIAIAEIAGELIEAVNSGEICLPLSATTIYETYKISNHSRRKEFAIFQTTMSQGKVFVGRHARLAKEIASLVHEILNLPKEHETDFWFLSEIFIEAFAEIDDFRVPYSMPPEVASAIRSDPSAFLLDYLSTAPEEERRIGVENWSNGSEALRQRVEKRRQLANTETMSMRRKVYSAQLFFDELEVIIKLARDAGAPWHNVKDIGEKDARRIIDEVPTFRVERELALRLEAQNRSIDENDFRDMMAFCTVVPYSDHVFAEKQFVNLTRQAGLHDEYATSLSSDLADIRVVL